MTTVMYVLSPLGYQYFTMTDIVTMTSDPQWMLKTELDATYQPASFLSSDEWR
jgi:hypothetical protein